MAYEKIHIPNSSKLIYWDESLPINQNILANLEGVRDDETVIIPAYIEGKHSPERMGHALDIIQKLKSHGGLFLPYEIEELLKTLPSHGKDGKPSLLYAIIQQAVRASTNVERKKNQQLAEKITEQKSQNEELSAKNIATKTALNTTRLKKKESDITLLDTKNAVEILEKEASRLEIDIVALENEMRTLGEQSTLIHKDQVAIKKMTGPEVIQYFKSKLTSLEASIERIPAQHEALVLKLDSLNTHQLSKEQSIKKTVDTLHKSIGIVVEKLKARLTAVVGEKKQGPGFFGNEAKKFSDSDIDEAPEVNINERNDFQDWDIKDNLWFNLQSKLTSYLNNGTHSPGRIKSAKSVLAKIIELHQSHHIGAELDQALLDFIREQTISSHGFNGKASDLHRIYQDAELFSREREANDVKSKKSELSSLKQTNNEVKSSIEQHNKEIEQLQQATLVNETQVKSLSQKMSDLERSNTSKKEKITGMRNQIALKKEALQKEESVNDATRWARLANDSKGREQVRKFREEISIQNRTKSELEEQLPTLTQEVENLERTVATLHKENNQKKYEIRHHYLLAKKLSRKIDPAKPLTGDAENFSLKSLVTSAESFVANLERKDRLEQSPQRKRAKTSTNPFDTPPIPGQPSQKQEGTENDTSEDTDEESTPLSPKDKPL